MAIVGTVNHDVILTRDGERRESLGGILYNAIPLAALLEGAGIEVRLFARVGAEDREASVRLLAGFAGVVPDGLIEDPAGTNRSILDYRHDADRREEVELRVAPLTRGDLSGIEGARAVLVNMISGRDVAAETLAAARRDAAGPFLLDVQALARSTESPRRPRAVPDWKEWCEPFDVVRGNEEEIRWFPGGPVDVPEAVARILGAGPSEVLVTRGASGSLRAVASAPGAAPQSTAAHEVAGAGDPTGCGDAFLSGVCAARVLGIEPALAPRLGAFVAAEVAALSGIESLVALRGVRERARRSIPELGL